MGLLTLVLRLVVERERLCAALDAQDCAGITRVGLAVSECYHVDLDVVTYDVDLVLGQNTNGRCATRDFLLVTWV